MGLEDLLATIKEDMLWEKRAKWEECQQRNPIEIPPSNPNPVTVETSFIGSYKRTADGPAIGRIISRTVPDKSNFSSGSSGEEMKGGGAEVGLRRKEMSRSDTSSTHPCESSESGRSVRARISTLRVNSDPGEGVGKAFVKEGSISPPPGYFGDGPGPSQEVKNGDSESDSVSAVTAVGQDQLSGESDAESSTSEEESEEDGPESNKGDLSSGEDDSETASVSEEEDEEGDSESESRSGAYDEDSGPSDESMGESDDSETDDGDSSNRASSDSESKGSDSAEFSQEESEEDSDENSSTGEESSEGTPDIETDEL